MCAGPPLHETVKLLSPLTNLEELSLGDNQLGGTITSDVAVFTKLKKLELYSMELDGKIGSTRSERLHSLPISFTFLSRMLAQGDRKARQFERVQRFQQRD